MISIKRKEGVYCPTVNCTACGEEISGMGNVLWFMYEDGDASGKNHGVPYFVHVKCDRVFEKSLQHEYPHELIGNTNILHWIVQLAYNAGIKNGDQFNKVMKSVESLMAIG